MKSLTKILLELNELVTHFDGHFSLKDASGKYFYVNDDFVSAVGKSKEKVIGKAAREIFSPHVADYIERSDKAAIESVSFLEYVNFTGLNDEHKNYTVFKCSIRDHTGRSLWLCTFACASELKDSVKSIRDKIQHLFGSAQVKVTPVSAFNN